MCAAWDLHQMVEEPTRYNSWLDLILTSVLGTFESTNFHSSLLSNDHSMTICCMFPSNSNKSCFPSTFPDFNNANYTVTAHRLTNYDWPTIFANCSSANEYWVTLYTEFKALINGFVPTRVVNSRQKLFC